MDASVIRYFLKKPGKGRASFELVAYTPIDRRKKIYLKLSPELKTQVQKVNEQFLAQTITQAEANVLLSDLIQEQYRRAGVRDVVVKNAVLSEANQKVFNKFWNESYAKRDLADHASAKYDFLKALRLIEPLSVLSASADKLLETVKKNAARDSEARRAIDRLNQMLRFLGRSERIQKPKDRTVRTIRHLTQPELDKVLKLVDDQAIRDLIAALFCTGLRLSEAMALTPADFYKGTLNVDKQLTRHGELKRPKREKVGRVFVIPSGIDAVKRWVNVSNKDDYREELRVQLAQACRKAFPKDKTKWVSPHDLRHSHAIYLLGKGASLTHVALNLRNRIEVCQRYYTGFAHSGDTIDVLKALF